MSSTTNPRGAALNLDFDAMPTIGDIVRYHARRCPDAVAMSFEGRETSWATLDAASNKVANALVAAGCKEGDRIAFVGKATDEFFEGRETSWATLDAASDKVASALVAAGCKAGDRIAFVGKATDEFFELMFGVAKIGAVLVPVQWRLAFEEVQQILDDAQVATLFVGSDQFDKLDRLRRVVPRSGPLIAMAPCAGWPDYRQWRDAASPACPASAVDASAVALQLYTSGTTGLPKGAMLSHRNLLSGRREGMRARMDWNEWLEGDVNLVALPVGHIGGIGWAIVGFLNGAKTIIHREFIPAQVLDAIEHQGVSKLFVVPTALQMLLLQPRVRQIDYRGLRHILYGASPIALDLLREATTVFGCGFCQQYGMTETCGTIVYLPPQDHDPAGNARMRAAGIPMPGVEIRIVDAQTREPLPQGQVGEVETRSVANMVGYWNNSYATAHTVSADGWLRTGDAGYLDEDGYLFIHDRFKDMIVSGAENIYPAEVENAIYGHPAVQEVAVIGVPDDKWGEAVKAIVVPRPGASPHPQDIIDFAKTRIAAFKAPKSIEFVLELPRGPSGKILRRVLREPYWSGRERRVN